jgi:hypothetical protein
MSNDQPEKPLPQTIISKPLQIVLIILLLLILVMLGDPTGYALTPLWLVLFGWIPFLVRNVQAMSWHSEALITWASCLLLFILVLHVSAVWFFRSWRPSVRWRKRWSVLGAAGITLLFTAGIAVIGIIHQTTWLARIDEPFLYADRSMPTRVILYSLVQQLEYDADGRARPTVEATQRLLERHRNGAAALNLRTFMASDSMGRVRVLAIGPYDSANLRRWDLVAFVELANVERGKSPRIGEFAPRRWSEFFRVAERGDALEAFYQFPR